MGGGICIVLLRKNVVEKILSRVANRVCDGNLSRATNWSLGDFATKHRVQSRGNASLTSSRLLLFMVRGGGAKPSVRGRPCWGRNIDIRSCSIESRHLSRRLGSLTRVRKNRVDTNVPYLSS